MASTSKSVTIITIIIPVELGELVLAEGGEGVEEADSVSDKDIDLINKINPKKKKKGLGLISRV